MHLKSNPLNKPLFMKKQVLFLCVLITSLCSAQTLKVTKATRQQWSGGVVGQHGVYYNFEFQTKSKSVIPDTIWVNNAYYVPDFSGKNRAYIRTVDSVTHIIKYAVTINESHHDFRRGPGVSEKDTVKATTTTPAHIRQFKGAAMVSYRLKHKQRFYILKTFTDLKPLNYP